MKNRFKQITDDYGQVTAIETPLRGMSLISFPSLNKGTGFTHDERVEFDLLGKLPYKYETIDEQVERFYNQFKKISDDLDKNLFLNNLKQTNLTVFYKMASQHLLEFLPIVYTPTIGDAVENFSYEFNKPSGLMIAYPDRDRIDEILDSRMHPEVDLIIMTDGEGVLGIGDWGVGGMDICIGKLMVYTLCAGINPLRTLPIQLDVGTNNEKLLNEPMYLGWRNKRISGKEYDDFIGTVVSAIQRKFPHVFLHWEDLGRDNARKNLERYRGDMCTFNDDIQGTGATALATVLSALVAKGEKLEDQRIVFFGAGTAGVGIADQLFFAMKHAGIDEQTARNKFYLIDRNGLLVDDMNDLMSFQKPYARGRKEVSQWQVSDSNGIQLLDVIKNVKPTILIGCSTVHGAFNQEVVQTMASFVERPFIFPLSNPTSLSEANPQDVFEWTNGKAIIAAGSPFPNVKFNNQEFEIAQCNNAYIFPGLGLGIIAAKATRVTDEMITAACHTLSQHSPAIHDHHARILPSLADMPTISKKIALAVAKKARQQKVAGVDDQIDLGKRIEAIIWKPEYKKYFSSKD